MNNIVSREGKVEKIKSHVATNCKVGCCGIYLDRRYLQYEGGNCECGVLLMEKLNIRPATDKEHAWRRALYVLNPGQKSKRKAKKLLLPVLPKLGIKKPHMLIWYIIAQGETYLEELRNCGKTHLERRLWKIYHDLNNEFAVNRPIQ